MTSQLRARLRRLFDERLEPRAQDCDEPATLHHDGRDHPVRVTNRSSSGARIVYGGKVAVGDELTLRLLDQGARRGQVRWVRSGRVGINFVDSAS